MMALVCAFTVYGDATPQGSLTNNGRGGVRYSNQQRLMAWRADIRAALQAQVTGLHPGLLRGPVAVRVRFAMPKPASVPKRRVFPTVTPDLDKLARAVGDSLEHVVLASDAQIVHWDLWKVYTDGRAEARIEIWQPDAIAPVVETNPFQQQGLF
jgi:Holliday junction resolvase RusA-like endonuclease